MAESRQFKKPAASQLALQNLQTIIPVDEIELAVVGAEDVVALDGLLSLARVRSRISTLFFSGRRLS